MADTTPQTDCQHCPKCEAAAAKAATMTYRFVYLRCDACGEVWVIPERRRLPRTNTRHAS